jgi:hypothetical protein
MVRISDLTLGSRFTTCEIFVFIIIISYHIGGRKCVPSRGGFNLNTWIPNIALTGWSMTIPEGISNNTTAREEFGGKDFRVNAL